MSNQGLFGGRSKKKSARDHLERSNARCDGQEPGASIKKFDPKKHSILGEGKNAERARNGWVVLIDEIDKAESDVPNGLLEALGAGSFKPLECDRVTIDETLPPPLIVITTNEERMLPDAFVRRCVVLHLTIPTNQDVLKAMLVDRGRVHFKDKTNDAVLEKGADILIRDRQEAINRNAKPLPGQAEYLDMIRAVIHQHPGNSKRSLEEQTALLEVVANFIVKKSVDMQSEESAELAAQEPVEDIQSESDGSTKASTKTKGTK